MGCGNSTAGQAQNPGNEKSVSMQTVATGAQLAGKLVSSVPVFGGIAGGCLTCIAIILINIDASQKMPEFLRKCRSKLVHIQALLTNFEDKKLISSGIAQDFFEELQTHLEDFRKFIEERLKKNQTSSKTESLINLFTSKSDLDKTEAFNVKLDAALSKFLLAKINDDINDQFPDFLKKAYKNKPGYDTWRNLFGNKEQKKADTFAQRYSMHNEVDQNSILQIIEVIDRDKNGSISFEEYMAFIDMYIYYFDEKGNRIRKMEQLLQRLKEDNLTMDTIKITEKRIEYPDGSVYEGDISDGQRNGKGKFTKGTNYSYVGEFKKDIRHGDGVEIKNGNKYEGEWSSNQKNGKGKLSYSDGSVYEGHFKSDLPDGKGKLTTDDGNIYEGQYEDGSMFEGIIYYKNGERYEGETKDTKFRHGRGRMYDATGKISFEGNFSENVPSQKYNYYSIKDKDTIMNMKNDISNIDIDLETSDGHDITLLSQLKKLNVLRICLKNFQDVRKNKDLAIQLLNNINSDAINNLTDLIIILPGSELQKIELTDFNELFSAIVKFKNIINLDLSIPSWGANNPAVDGKVINELIQTYQQFKKLKYLKLDLFEWGYLNPNIKNEQVIDLIKGLEEFEEGQLISFSMDLGKWGCEETDNYHYLTDFTMGKIGNLIENQKSLEELSLNIRSWAYKNKQITSMGCKELFDGLGKLKKLRKLFLGLRAIAYENEIKQQTIEHLVKSLKKLKNLEEITINLEVCDNFTSFEPIRNLNKDLTKLQNLVIISDQNK